MENGTARAILYSTPCTHTTLPPLIVGCSSTFTNLSYSMKTAPMFGSFPTGKSAYTHSPSTPLYHTNIPLQDCNLRDLLFIHITHVGLVLSVKSASKGSIDLFVRRRFGTFRIQHASQPLTSEHR